MSSLAFKTDDCSRASAQSKAWNLFSLRALRMSTTFFRIFTFFSERKREKGEQKIPHFPQNARSLNIYRKRAMGKTTRSPRKLRKKHTLTQAHMDDDEKRVVLSYQTPKSKLKSALKKSNKSRYQHHHRVEEEDEENRNRLISPSSILKKKKASSSPLSSQRRNVNFVEKEEDDDDDSNEDAATGGWNFDQSENGGNNNGNSLVKRPPPTPSTPFHFARDFFENGCESDVDQTTVSSECGGFRFDLDAEEEEKREEREENIARRLIGTPAGLGGAKARHAAAASSSTYLAGQRDAYRDALLHESLPLQKLVERQKQKVEALTKKQEKMEESVKEQSIVSAVLIERTNVEKEHAVKLEEMGAKLCASVEKLQKEVIVLKSAEKERKKTTPKMQKFLERCVGIGAFFLGKETRSMLLESPISKKLFDTEEEEEAQEDAETPTPSTPPKKERTSEELATALALCVALEAIAKVESSKMVPLRAPLPIRIGMYLSRVYLWSEFLGVSHREIATLARNTTRLCVLAAQESTPQYQEEEEEKQAVKLVVNELAPSDANTIRVLENMARFGAKTSNLFLKIRG